MGASPCPYCQSLGLCSDDCAHPTDGVQRMRCAKTTKDGTVQCQGSEGHQGPCFIGGVLLADFDRMAEVRNEEKVWAEVKRRAKECKHSDQACQIVYFINDSVNAEALWRSKREKP